MLLPRGTRLGPYEIQSTIGAGGMGEVYRARDTRLDRTGAIKILPENLTGTPELHHRFEREARAISGLNHPHICTLHDIGHQDGIDFLVMEYLEGETLAKRLERGSLSAQELSRIATEIADALDRAHRQGVIHRDLKPGNIMLTKAGTKLLDFGLAKTALAPVGGELSSSPTLSQPLTECGTLVGTLQYMSPEQLEGKEADARSDIFAFGGVLYEMATGRKAFEGNSQASLIAAILEREPPPISSLQPCFPPALEHVVRTCLCKDPDERWQTAHDVLLQLKWICEAGSQAGLPVPVIARGRFRQNLGWLAAALCLSVLLIVLPLNVGYFHRNGSGPRAIRFSIPAPQGTTFDLPLGLSPDGRNLVFVAVSGGKNQLWVRPIDSLESRLLSGTEEATFPFWSPDSRFIGFFAEGRLKKIELSTGTVQTLAIESVPDPIIEGRHGVKQVSSSTPLTRYRLSIGFRRAAEKQLQPRSSILPRAK
jgi:eukaryotic-like serine/threonine-protein kinase